MGFLYRGRCIDNRGIDQCARAQRDTLVGQMRIHVGEDRLRKPVTPKIEDGSLVWDAVIAQFDPYERAHGLTTIKRLRDRRVAQCITNLQ